MLLLTQLEYTRPFISKGGALDVSNGKKPSELHASILIPSVAASSRVSPKLQKLFTHSNVSPSTIMSSARSSTWISPSYRIPLKSTATRENQRTPLHHIACESIVLHTVIEQLEIHFP